MVDLNCDMGEGIGEDALMLEIVSSANIACGAHAGGPEVMRAVMAEAKRRGVRVGAHPGFDDRENFGRLDHDLPPEALADLIDWQMRAALEAATEVGVPIAHVKLHGALANMATREREIARICYRQARANLPEVALMVIAGTEQARAAAELGGPVISEIFADRSYEADGTLTPRAMAGAVIHDADYAAARVLDMVQRGVIVPREGAPIALPIDSICVHGDTLGAVEMARKIRTALLGAGLAVSA